MFPALSKEVRMNFGQMMNMALEPTPPSCLSGTTGTSFSYPVNKQHTVCHGKIIHLDKPLPSEALSCGVHCHQPKRDNTQPDPGNASSGFNRKFSHAFLACSKGCSCSEVGMDFLFCSLEKRDSMAFSPKSWDTEQVDDNPLWRTTLSHMLL